MSLFPWRESDYYSPGFQNLIFALRPQHGLSTVQFPYRCSVPKISKTQSIHGWFEALVDQQLNGLSHKCAVEPNMGVFAHLKFDGNNISYANIQIIISTNCDLETLYSQPDNPYSYLRFDYDPKCMGRMFSEPLPHIHTVPNGAPRFRQPLGSGNIVLDFFDFIYRNFYHENWSRWANDAYCRYAANRNKPDMFNAVNEAFRASNYSALAEGSYSDALIQIKEACRMVKDKIYSPRVSTNETSYLDY